MSHESMFGEEWFASLEEFDRQIAEAVAAEGCRHCGGPLYQGNYERKPRAVGSRKPGKRSRCGTRCAAGARAAVSERCRLR
jgi:hypothetical protein